MSANKTTSSVDLSDDKFIRHKMYVDEKSIFERYAGLVLAKPSPLKLILYEIIITLIGPIPGALGLVLRKCFYPFLLGTVGNGVVFGRSITLRHPENIHLGDKVVLDDYCLIDARGAGDGGIHLDDNVMINRNAALQAKVGGIDIGKGTSIGSGVNLISQGRISIEENVSIAGGSTIAGGRYVVPLEGYDTHEKKRRSYGEIRIGKGTRIGMCVLVQDGVDIGESAIVAPGSVVLNNVPDFVVVSGSPAKPWRARDPDHNISKDRIPDADDSQFIRELIAKRIRDYLEETVFVDFGKDGFSDTDSLLDNNIQDSVGFVTMSVWMEEEFDITVEDDEMLPENMDTVASIVSFITRKKHIDRAKM